MTAIAAVLAFSSTPLLAQAVDAPVAAPADPAPVTGTPVLPPAAAPVAEAAPAAALNIPRISINMDDAAQAEGPAAATARTTAAPKAATSPRSATPQPVAKAAVPAAPEATPPAVAEAVPAPVIAAEPAVVPPPVAKAAPPAPVNPVAGDDDTLPIAGAAGLGVLALAGGAFALSRRRKRHEFDSDVADEPPMAVREEPMPVRDEMLLTDPAPAAATPARTPIRDDAPAAAMPAGFDLSRYGRHVQAAYRGPTPENPSLSLKNRLRRARFFDQRERQAGTILATQAEEHAEPAMARSESAVTPRRTDHVTTRPANWRKPDFRPAFQS